MRVNGGSEEGHVRAVIEPKLTTYPFLMPHGRQTWYERVNSPVRRRGKYLSNDREVAHGVIKQVKNVGRLHIRSREVFLVEEMERIAKRELGDHVTNTRLDHVMHWEDLLVPAGLVHPPKEVRHALLHDGLEPTDTGT